MEGSVYRSQSDSKTSRFINKSNTLTGRVSSQNKSFLSKIHKRYPPPRQSTFDLFDTNCSFQTEHLKLTLIELSDEQLYIDIFTDENVTTYTGGQFTIQQAKLSFYRAIKAVSAVPVKYITWVVEEKNDGEKLGILTLTLLNNIASCGEFGLMFKPSFHSRGLGSEVVDALISIAFNTYQLKLLVSYTEKENTRAQHILKKYNFKPYQSDRLVAHTATGVYWSLVPRIDSQ